MSKIKRYLYALFLSYTVVLHAKTISFQEITQKAIEESSPLKIIDSNRAIYEAKIEEIESLYYPTLSLGLNAQYSKDLDSDRRGSSSIGDTYFSDQTQYETSVSLRLNYELYDAGVRANKIKISEIDKALVTVDYHKSIEELKLELLDTYVKLLNIKEELRVMGDIKKLNYLIYQQKKRLYEAGEIDKLALSSEAISLIELDTKITTLENSLKDQLTQLSYYTKESYTLEIQLSPLSFVQHKASYSDTVTHQSFQMKERQKQYELALVKAQKYPTVTLFGKYNLYGSKECSLWCALEDTKERNYVVGMGINIPIFDGFKTDASKKRIHAEIVQLKLQDQEQEEIFFHKQYKNKVNLQSISNQIEQTQESIKEQQYKSTMVERLRAVHEIDSFSEIKEQIATLYNLLTLHKHFIEESAKLKEMEILNDTGGRE